MKQDNILVDKSFKFAVKIVKLYDYLSKNKREFVLSKQLLKSGTSIGANISESQDAQSRNDFISKLSIALKEARETKYWIELLKETKYLPNKEADNIIEDTIELIKLLTTIIKTTRSNHGK
jgi:four helix bundle protein